MTNGERDRGVGFAFGVLCSFQSANLVVSQLKYWNKGVLGQPALAKHDWCVLACSTLNTGHWTQEIFVCLFADNLLWTSFDLYSTPGHMFVV